MMTDPKRREGVEMSIEVCPKCKGNSDWTGTADDGIVCLECGGKGHIADPFPDSETGWGCSGCGGSGKKFTRFGK